MTLVVVVVKVAWAALCSLPRLYRTNQVAVDQGIEKAKVITCKTKLKAMEKVVEIKDKVDTLLLSCEAKLLVQEKAGEVKDKVIKLAGEAVSKVMCQVEHED